MTPTTIYSKQAAFNIIFSGLRAQGFKRAMTDGACMYRGDEGKKCAVGHLIPDELYKPNLECRGGREVLGMVGIEVEADKSFLTGKYPHGFVAGIQLIHDSFIEDTMEVSLREFAVEHGLTIPE